VQKAKVFVPLLDRFVQGVWIAMFGIPREAATESAIF
jgi:hypothetical protein